MRGYTVLIKTEKEGKLSPLIPFINVFCNALVEFILEELTEEELQELSEILKKNKRNQRRQTIVQFLKQKTATAQKTTTQKQTSKQSLDLSKYEDLL
ncbi:MAG: hypothetical protein QW067_11105 [Thermofilaceae archaeon]